MRMTCMTMHLCTCMYHLTKAALLTQPVMEIGGTQYMSLRIFRLTSRVLRTFRCSACHRNSRTVATGMCSLTAPTTVTLMNLWSTLNMSSCQHDRLCQPTPTRCWYPPAAIAFCALNPQLSLARVVQTVADRLPMLMCKVLVLFTSIDPVGTGC